MAVSNTKALLKDMLKELNDAYARGQLDARTQIVTFEKNNIVEAWKEGYTNLLNKHKNTNFPDINSIDWMGGVSRDWDNIHDAIIKANGHVIEYSPDRIVFKESKYTKTMHDTLKNFSVSFIQKQVGNYKLTDATAEVNNNPSLSFQAAAGLSDVGVIKKGQHRLHKGNTAVGAARLVLAMKWISKTKFFKDFTSSKQAKKLEEVYGDIFATFKTKGTKKRGLKLLIDEDIEIEINAAGKNPRGGEPTDWSGKGNIEANLTKALLSWAKEAELAGVQGSSSIEDNAKNATTYNVVSEFKKIKGAIVKTTSNSRTRGKKNVPVSNKRKSPKTSKKAVARKPNNGAKVKATQGFSQTKLYAALSAKINPTVAKNMGEPALQYQTGRFASSVKITDVGATPQGFPSVGYTYQLYPYQTFEPGFRQGSVERDPRKLIDGSIREIAAQMVVGRLYTRRL